MRVLIVEDEPVIGLDLQTMLDAAGHRVAGIAGSVRSALNLIPKAEFDLALLDLNLAGQSARPVAEALRERKITYICMTGYAAHRLPAALRQQHVLLKPVEPARLLAALETVSREAETAD